MLLIPFLEEKTDIFAQKILLNQVLTCTAETRKPKQQYSIINIVTFTSINVVFFKVPEAILAFVTTPAIHVSLAMAAARLQSVS